MNKRINFEKMNGLGNQIIVADMRGHTDTMTSQAALHLANDSKTQFDQIMVIYDSPSHDYDYNMEIWNQDGTQAQSCGNGTRCVVEWLYQKTGQNDFTFNTKAGKLSSQRLDNGLVCVDMGEPKLQWQDIPTSKPLDDTLHVSLSCGPLNDPVLVSMGNPHAVFFVENDVWTYPLEEYGPILENDPLFLERCNITIAQIISKTHICIRTWERGAGLTKACGTAACATAISAVRRGLSARQVKVQVPGGILEIEWKNNNHVIMTGPTEFEFSGKLDPKTGAFEIMEDNNISQNDISQDKLQDEA